MMALVPREFHMFNAAGTSFLYLVPSAAMFALDDATSAVVRVVSELKAERRRRGRVAGRSFRAADDSGRDRRTDRRARDRLRASAGGRRRRAMLPMMPFPLNTMVLNVTNQCNLACTYCYEYGEDKIVDTANGQQAEVHDRGDGARERRVPAAGERPPIAHLTFFGGETLLNFPVLQSTIAYARRRAAETGKEIDFSLTTNATLLRPDIIEFLAENGVGVTISIDGPREMQDKFRVFHNGSGQLRRRRAEDQGAAAAASQPADRRARHADVRHARHHADLPAPHRGDRLLGSRLRAGDHVAAAAVRDRRARASIECSTSSAALAREFARARRREPASRLLEREGHARGDPQGRQQGVSVRRGSRAARRVDRRRRRALPSLRRLGRAQARHRARRHRPRARRAPSSQQHHIADKTDCRKCWARPLCSGGCYHEAHMRYGDTAHPNLHYCEWIRGWTETCLEIYGELSERNPSFSHNSIARKRRKREACPVTHLKAINRKARRIVEQSRPTTTSSRCSRGRRSSRSRIFRSAARWCFRPAGKRTRPAARPDCASRSSATSSTATSAASGPRRCRTS